MPSFSLFSSSGPGRPGHRGGGPTASTPLLGRLGRGANDNAPLRPRQSQLGLLSTYLGSRAVAGGASGGGGGGGWGAGGGWGSLGGPGGRGSVHVGYGALVASQLAQEANEEEEQEAARRALERRARTRARQRRFEGAWSDSDSSDDSSSESGSDDEDHDGGRLWLRLPGRVRRRSGFPKLRIRKRAGRVADWARRTVRDLWVEPRQGAVKKVVDVWWSRWGVLVILPAALAIAWCAIPFPQYPLDENDTSPGGGGGGKKTPGHGAAKVRVNFWFFLFVYYGFYNLTALIWITKIFNIYRLNWWPQSLGFPLTVALIALASLSVPVPLYLIPETRFLTTHNTAWISWSFVVMALPVGIAFAILTTNQRHLGDRADAQLSETQRIFTSSWWTGDGFGDFGGIGTLSEPPARRRDLSGFDPDLASLQLSADGSSDGATAGAAASSSIIPAAARRANAPSRSKRWLPASFVRFIWFCLALSVGLLAYVLGEAYAEIYLDTLPHGNLETIVYVWSWVATVHLLDALTAWILGGSEGERVGSYPLSWIFKLYFMLTYQTYVRALYARLRSPTQFIWLQVLSSSSLIVLTPLTMSTTYHWLLVVLGLTGQSYAAYQKLCVRNVFIRFLAENVSMLTFLGSVVVLHFGANKDVYPFFAFDTASEDGYDFNLTFYASSVTWACELVAAAAVRALVAWLFGVSVAQEGKLDLAVWPELLPTSAAVMLHVMQNMLFSIIRLQFR